MDVYKYSKHSIHLYESRRLLGGLYGNFCLKLRLQHFSTRMSVTTTCNVCSFKLRNVRIKNTKLMSKDTQCQY